MNFYKKLLTHSIILSTMLSCNVYGIDSLEVEVNRYDNALISTEASLYPHNVSKLKRLCSSISNTDVKLRIKQIESYTEKLQDINRELDSFTSSDLRKESIQYAKLIDILDTLKSIPLSSFKYQTINKIEDILVKTTPKDKEIIKSLSSQISKNSDLNRLEKLRNKTLCFTDMIVLRFFDMKVGDRQREIDLQNSIKSLKKTNSMGEILENIRMLPDESEGKSDIIRDLPMNFEIKSVMYESPKILDDTLNTTNKFSNVTQVETKKEVELSTNEVKSLLDLKLNNAEKIPTEGTLKDVLDVYEKYKSTTPNKDDLILVDKRISNLRELVNQKLAMDYVEKCETSLTQSSYETALSYINKISNDTLGNSLKDRLYKIQPTININEALYSKGKDLINDYTNLINMGKVNLNLNELSVVIDKLNVKSYKEELSVCIQSIKDKLESNKFLLDIASIRVREALTTYNWSDIIIAEKSVNQLKDKTLQMQLIQQLDKAKIISKQKDVLLKSSVTINFILNDNKTLATTTLYLNNEENFKKAYSVLGQIFDLVSTDTDRFVLRGEVVRISSCKGLTDSTLDISRLNKSYSEKYNKNIFDKFKNNELLYGFYGIKLGKSSNIDITVNRCYNKTDLSSLTSEMSKDEENLESSTTDLNKDILKNMEGKIILGDIPSIEMMMNTFNINFNTDNLRDIKLESSVDIAIKSNKSYNLSVKAEDDFRMNLSSAIVDINNLGISTDDATYLPLSTSYDTLLYNDVAVGSTVHTAMFKMSRVDNIRPGLYKTTLTFKAKQK